MGSDISRHSELSRHSATEAVPGALTPDRFTREPVSVLADDLVFALRRLDYSVNDLLREAASVRRRLLAVREGNDLLHDMDRLDGLINQCIERTSFIHETAIESSLHGFCELDQQGRVRFANPRMLELAATCAGQPLETLFTEPDRVAGAIASPGSQLLRTQIASREGPIPVILELGRADGPEITTCFALLTDMRGFIDAEKSVYDSAPYGVVRLGADFLVNYANSQISKLFGLSSEELLGTNLAALIDDPKSRALVARHIEERKKGKATEYRIRATDRRTRICRHIRVSSVPEMDEHGGQLVGVVVMLHDITATVVSEALGKVIALEREPSKMFAQLVRQVRDVIDFKQASLSIYSEEMRYARTIYSDPPGDQLSLWIELTPDMRSWIGGAKTWEPDLRKFIERQPNRDSLGSQASVKNALESGLKSFLSVPVGAGPTGAFNLTSLDYEAFAAEHFGLLKEAGIDRSMSAVIAAHYTHERNEIFKLVKDMTQAADSKALAATVVDSLSRLYHWQQVSIFKVNRIAGQFELLAQKPSKKNGIRLPRNYAQSIDKGLLGEAYASGKPVELEDTRRDTELAKRYVPGSAETRSELCIPIEVNGRIVWILNCEDRRPNAFKEAGMLHRVIDEISKTLVSLFERMVLIQMIDKYPDGVVIVTAEGQIITANKFAFAMFGKRFGDDRLAGEDIAQFFDQEFSFTDPSAPLRRASGVAMTVIGVHGFRTPVLLSSFTLPDEYDQYILILQDASELLWQAEHQRFNAALVEATAQVRVPLAIATSNIRYLGRQVTDKKLAEIIERACANLSRVELTYDRLQLAFDSRALPPAISLNIDVREVLDEVIGYFSPDDVAATEVDARDVNTTIDADPYRLLFAIEAILSYLVRTRTGDDRIHIRLRRTQSELAIRFVGSAVGPAADGRASHVLEGTRARIALAEKVIRKAIGTHGQYRRTRSWRGPQVHTLVFKRHFNALEAS